MANPHTVGWRHLVLLTKTSMTLTDINDDVKSKISTLKAVLMTLHIRRLQTSHAKKNPFDRNV